MGKHSNNLMHRNPCSANAGLAVTDDRAYRNSIIHTAMIAQVLVGLKHILCKYALAGSDAAARDRYGGADYDGRVICSPAFKLKSLTSGDWEHILLANSYWRWG
jgi:hypothetical protein